ncbi:E3 ubiquitin-protein ligase XBAT32 [Silene latifolia]|uniref:E3 ubiquitin-protein ligase XBAT32 n=1 Tax=Silene latifolia TaxID=37657 RepID=UPI003D7825D3
MRFLNIVGNSLGCSASGERLVSAARDGDLQEAKALLDYNPRLVKYSTFGVRNSPLHYSAAQGHHEIVSLLLETGVDINLRNYRGQTALMQACQHGHWEVVQTLIVFKANIHRADYLNGGTALHLAALNGHTRCMRLILADYIPSIPNIWNILRKKSKIEFERADFNASALYQVINKPADGGITALHMAALNGHFEAVQLLLEFGASVTEKTVEDGTTIDLIGAGSTALHYAACGGNVQCCKMLIERGAKVTAENENGRTPLMVARSWHRDSVVEMLSTSQNIQLPSTPSYLCLPMMSIIKIARDCGWRNSDFLPTCQDPCVVCLEGKCTVASEGCNHEFCTRCALYLCTMNCSSMVAKGPPGSIACPLCRHGIVSFIKLPGPRPVAKEIARTSLSLSFCGCSSERLERASLTAPLCNPPPLGSSFGSLSCRGFPSVKFSSGFCRRASETNPCIVSGSVNQGSRNELNKCARIRLRRSSSSHVEGSRKSWFCSLNQYVATSG